MQPKEAIQGSRSLRIAGGEDDIETITKLINTAFEVERFFLDSDRINADEVRQRLLTGCFLIAEDNGAPSGCVYVELRGDRGYVGLLSVDPSRQGTGLGSRLMQAAEDFARGNGCRHMDITVVNLRTELPGFYRSLGYVEVGTAPFTAGVRTKLPCHFLKMSKPLREQAAPDA